MNNEGLLKALGAIFFIVAILFVAAFNEGETVLPEKQLVTECNIKHEVQHERDRKIKLRLVRRIAALQDELKGCAK